MRTIRIIDKREMKPEEILVDQADLVENVSGATLYVKLPGVAHNDIGVQVRSGGTPFDGKAFFLSKKFDWKLGRDAFGEYILVPLKKKSSVPF